MIIVSGPEGSGTTYAWRCIKSSTGLKGMRNFTHAQYDQRDFPTEGCHHISLPSMRPARWINQFELPESTRFVFILREKKFAVASVKRRWPETNAERCYDMALTAITELASRHMSLIVPYKSLGELEAQKEVTWFCGGENPDWEPFKHKGG